MNNATPEFYSNNPRGIVALINGQRCSVEGISKARSEAPAVFLFNPIPERSGDDALDISEWTRDVRKLIAAYQSYPGNAVMFNVDDLERCQASIATEVTRRLALGDTIDQCEIHGPDRDIKWTLIFKSYANAQPDLFMLSEEAAALCTPVTKADGSGRSIEEANGSAPPTAVTDLEKLLEENQLLTLQLEQAQEELAGYVLGGHTSRESNDAIAVTELVKIVAPHSTRRVRAFAKVLFDPHFYLEQSGVRFGGLAHYRLRGWKREYNPHPLFDQAYYLAQVGLTVKSVNMAPMVHYCRYGNRLNVSPHPDFDAAFYRRQYPDVAQSGLPMIVHFIKHGWREARMPSPRFDPGWYLAQNTDVDQSGMNPLVHYVLYGRNEGRRPGPPDRQ